LFSLKFQFYSLKRTFGSSSLLNLDLLNEDFGRKGSLFLRRLRVRLGNKGVLKMECEFLFEKNLIIKSERKLLHIMSYKALFKLWPEELGLEYF